MIGRNATAISFLTNLQAILGEQHDSERPINTECVLIDDVLGVLIDDVLGVLIDDVLGVLIDDVLGVLIDDVLGVLIDDVLWS